MNKLFLFCLIACFVGTNASHSIVVRDYYTMLEAFPDVPELYSEEMASDPIGCGITRTETEMGHKYKIVAGMEEQQMKGVTPWQQEYYEYWIEQGRPQEKEEEFVSPLMMFGKNEKKEAKREAEQQSEEAVRNREMTDSNVETNLSASSRQRGTTMPAIRETSENPLLTLEITMRNSETDEISTISEATTTQEKTYHSSFTPRDIEARRCQVLEALKVAQEKSKAVANHLNELCEQWEISNNLETEKQQYNRLQEQTFSAFHLWEKTLIAFEEAERGLRSVHPTMSLLAIAATAHEKTRNNAWQKYQVLLAQTQAAFARYTALQERAIARNVVEGVDYGDLLKRAQRHANEADKNLQKCRAEWMRIKVENGNISSQNLPLVVRDHELPLKKSDVAEFSKHKTIYQDQETQISKEDLEAWEREAFLKKQAHWKSIFHGMVASMNQAKEAAIAEVSKKWLEKILLEESEKESQEIAKQTLQEAKILAAVDLKQLTEKVTIVLVKEQNVFSELFPPGTEATELEKRALEKASMSTRRQAKEASRSEMEKFCTERVKLLHPSKEEGSTHSTRTWMEAIMPIVESGRNFMIQAYHRPYEWGCDTLQFLQDQREVQREAGKQTDEYFAAQGKSLLDIPTAEYALKTAEIAQQLYANLVAKRIKEKAVPPIATRTKSVSATEVYSNKELSYWEQGQIFLKKAVFLRFLESCFTKKYFDKTRESDRRALDYLKRIGNLSPQIGILWVKSAEIEETLKLQRQEKRQEIMAKAASPEEGERQFQEWCNAWPERFETEVNEREAVRLKEKVADEEAARRKIQQKLIEQEQKEKEEKQKRKSKNPPKKK